jgi:thermitase
MKKIFLTFALAILYSVSYNNGNTIENVSRSRYAKDHFIVKIKSIPLSASNISIPQKMNEYLIQKIANENNIEITKVKSIFPFDKNHVSEYYAFELDKFYLVYISGINNVSDCVEKYQLNSLVDFSEPDYIGEAAGISSNEELQLNNFVTGKPNDEYFYRQWGLYNDGTVETTKGREGKKGGDMKVLEGWDIETGSSDVIVAILDSGAKTDHPELEGRIWENTKETNNGIDDDDNGYADDLYGWNFANENPNVRDDGGHGTNISGTVGSNTNNSIGYAGVNQKCKLMICKNLDNENLGDYSWWSASLYYAANNGAKVINMSEGGYDFSKTLKTAVDFAYNSGAIIFASMMNKNNNESYYPASFENVMAIGATDTDDSRCRQFSWGGGSNWGKHIAVVAPGNRIYGLDYHNSNDYSVYWSGTSQATAYCSALASLILSQNPNRTNKELYTIITSTADDQVGDRREDTPGWDQYHGYGRINVFNALNFDKTYEKKNDDYNKKPDDKIKNDNKNNNDDQSRKAKAVPYDEQRDDDKYDDHRAKKKE